MLDEFSEFCDRLEKTCEWGGQAEVFHFVLVSMHIHVVACYSALQSDVSVDRKELIKFRKLSVSGYGSRNFFTDSSTL